MPQSPESVWASRHKHVLVVKGTAGGERHAATTGASLQLSAATHPMA